MSSLRMKRKMERLALIRERYRSLILEPRRRIEMELDRDLDEDYAEDEFARESEGVFAEVSEDDDAR
jgi:hypothetical protein